MSLIDEHSRIKNLGGGAVRCAPVAVRSELRSVARMDYRHGVTILSCHVDTLGSPRM